MFTTERPYLAIVEALAEPVEYHGRVARVAYIALRNAGHDAEAAAYYAAAALLDNLDTIHKTIRRNAEFAPCPTGAQLAHEQAEYARRLIVMRDLKNLVELWKQLGVAA